VHHSTSHSQILTRRTACRYTERRERLLAEAWRHPRPSSNQKFPFLLLLLFLLCLSFSSQRVAWINSNRLIVNDSVWLCTSSDECLIFLDSGTQPTNQPTNQQIIATLKYSFLSRTSNWNTTFKVKKKNQQQTNKDKNTKKTKTKQQSKIVTCFRYHNLCASECEFLPLSLNVLKGWILRNHKTTATTNYKSRKSGHPLKELKQNRNGPLFKRVDNIFVHYHY